MQTIINTMDRFYSVTDIPLMLLDGEGRLIQSWPDLEPDTISPEAMRLVIEDFRLQKQDSSHPLISFFDPGFLLGVVEVRPSLYVLIGLVSPYVQTRADVLKMVSQSIHPAHLQVFCDRLLHQRQVSLEQLKDMICLLTGLLRIAVPEENIRFVDNASTRKLGEASLDQSMFLQREEPELHVPVDFETAICSAVEAGDQTLLERRLFTPYHGRVGRMSANDLRQQKYSFICMATLVSRAAIRGGLNAETAFSLSDLYCQRADLLMEIPLIQNLTVTMLMDFCGKVREIRKQPAASAVIQNCLNYISVHLHEDVSLAQLSRHCGLCGRSLSLRFREELGMGIPAYIHREKLREAEYLLKSTDYSLSEIASYLNYSSQSYFTKVFRDFYGKTPQQFRDRA